MNSVHLYVKDAMGAHFLTTFTANTEENVSSFRRHAAYCKRYWQSADYRRRVDPARWPVFPVTVHVEPYDDTSQR